MRLIFLSKLESLSRLYQIQIRNTRKMSVLPSEAFSIDRFKCVRIQAAFLETSNKGLINQSLQG